MSSIPLLETRSSQFQPLCNDAGSPSKHPQTNIYEELPGGIAFGNTGTCNGVQFGHSKALPADPDVDKQLPSGDRTGVSITDLLGSIVIALVLKLLNKPAGDEADPSLPMKLFEKTATTPDASLDIRSPFSPSATGSPEGHPTLQPNAQFGAGNPLGVHVKSMPGATGPSAADPNRPPEGMPGDLWKDCIHACNRQGGDPFILAAQLKQETQWGTDKGNAADGVAQVEASTRDAYAARFRESTGHDYDHSSQADQIELAQLIKVSKGGDERNQLMKYNGGDNWAPGALDSLDRPIHADTYATQVLTSAEELRRSAN